MTDVSGKTSVPGLDVVGLSHRNRKAALSRHRNERTRRRAEALADIKRIILSSPSIDVAAEAILARWVNRKGGRI
jgi:hypothetical protein